MQNEPLAARSPRPIGGSVMVFLALAATTVGLTFLFLGMRAVMEIGGACAEGGPFVPVRPCPKGIPLVMIGGIWGGLIFAGIYAWQVVKHQVPSFLGLLWPALFLSLGWNFLEFGLNPPFGEGVAVGWLVCAALFAAMGGLPLIWTLKVLGRRLRGESPASVFMPVRDIRKARKQLTALMSTARQATARLEESTALGDEPHADAADDLVTSLERLERLRAAGALDEAEYDEAKRRIIEGRA